jgi:hypothetical protein
VFTEVGSLFESAVMRGGPPASEVRSLGKPWGQAVSDVDTNFREFAFHELG